MNANANEEWMQWMDQHWPKPTPKQQTLLWSLWCKAWTGGRIQERQRSGGLAPRATDLPDGEVVAALAEALVMLDAQRPHHEIARVIESTVGHIRAAKHEAPQAPEALGFLTPAPEADRPS